MKRPRTIKIEGLQSSVPEVSIQEMSEEQANQIIGGQGYNLYDDNTEVPWPPCPDDKSPY
jgi:hypothetical protein